MDHSTTIVWAFTPVLILAALSAINIGIAQIRISSTSAKHRRNLRSALHAELNHLDIMYNNNLRFLREGKGFVLSARASLLVYKGNLGRLHLLSEIEIPKIVEAYASCERIESLVSAIAKASGSLAYYIIKDYTSVDDIIDQYVKGREEVLSAILIIEHRGRATLTEAYQRRDSCKSDGISSMSGPSSVRCAGRRAFRWMTSPSGSRTSCRT